MNDDDDRPAMITHQQHRRLLKMLEDYERRQWLWGFIGRVAKWIAAVGAAVTFLLQASGKYR